MSLLRKIGFWKPLFAVILVAGLYSTYVRFFHGLGAATNLSDEFPWGLWVGFDCLCGIMLTAGGFALMATVHVFNLEKYKAIARPALVTAFLGYGLEMVAVLFDLGRPYRIWHPLVMWNPRSPMFVVGWCVMLYTTIMALEFAPTVFEKLNFEKPLRILRALSVPLVILGVVVSVVHQSALGTFYVLVPGKLHALWYSPILPILFFVSSVAAGIAMTIFESGMSSRHFAHALERPLIANLGRVLLVTLVVYGVIRVQDLFRQGAWPKAFVPGYESSLFWVEMALTLILPIALLSFAAIREEPRRLYGVAILTVAGFVTNRLNVAVTGMESWAGVRYVPKWTEVSITLMMVSIGIFLFAMAVRYLPIFGHGEHGEDTGEPLPARAVPPATPLTAPATVH
jgi:Ni/Fe-hydrogenase subunit HybB-like protein